MPKDTYSNTDSYLNAEKLRLLITKLKDKINLDALDELNKNNQLQTNMENLLADPSAQYKDLGQVILYLLSTPTEEPLERYLENIGIIQTPESLRFLRDPLKQNDPQQKEIDNICDDISEYFMLWQGKIKDSKPPTPHL